MDKVQCVSLPRSGHNLLVSHLQKYFAPSSICKPERSGFLKLGTAKTATGTPKCQFHYCEYYYACRSHPCTNPGNKFQKSHDFELDLPVDLGQKYLIQKRAPIDLLISWFELRLPKNRETDSADGFTRFVKRMQPYVKGFQDKWVVSKLPHRLIFDYEDYLCAPAEHLTKAIQFFDASITPNISLIETIVADVRPPKDNRQFRFIDSVDRNLCA
jgi:hypothetical protein